MTSSDDVARRFGIKPSHNRLSHEDLVRRRTRERRIIIAVFTMVGAAVLGLLGYRSYQWYWIRQIELRTPTAEVEALIGPPHLRIDADDNLRGIRVFTFSAILDESTPTMRWWVGAPVEFGGESFDIDDLVSQYEFLHWHEIFWADGILIGYDDGVAAVYLGGMD